MKSKRIIALFLTLMFVVMSFQTLVFAEPEDTAGENGTTDGDTIIDDEIIDLPDEEQKLAEVSASESMIGPDTLVAKKNNLALYFIEYAPCLAESTVSINSSGEPVINEKMTGLKDSVLLSAAAGLRPVGVKVGKVSVYSSTKLEEGDIITHVNGVAVSTAQAFVDELAKYGLNESVELTYLTKTTRSGKLSLDEFNGVLSGNLRENQDGVYLSAASEDLSGFKAGDVYNMVTYTITTITKTVVNDSDGNPKLDDEGNVTYKVTRDKEEFEREFSTLSELRAIIGSITLNEEETSAEYEIKLEGFTYSEKQKKLNLGYKADAVYVVDSQDSENPRIWRSKVDETVYDMDSFTQPQWYQRSQSLVIINTDRLRTEVKTGTKVASFSGNPSNASTSAKIEDGKLIYSVDFTDRKIKFNIEFGLTDDEMYAKIPYSSLEEYGTGDMANRLVDIDLLPFFGASNKSEGGYMFIPDGSGMLLDFDDHVNESYRKEHTYYVSGTDILDMDTYLDTKSYNEIAYLPVIGMKDGNRAFVAYTAGLESDVMVAATPGFAIPLYRTNFKFRYRYVTDIMATNINFVGAGVVTDVHNKETAGKRYTDDIINTTDREIRYRFMVDDQANYSGMANGYRDFLVKENYLTARTESESIPIVLDIFMATWESQILFQNTIAMTTFGQAEDMLKELKDAGLIDITVMFKGWQKGGYGYFPRTWPIESSVGGKSGAVDFAKFAKENNINALFEAETVLANSDTGGFSTKNHVIAGGNSITVSDLSEKNYFLNASATETRLKELYDNVGSVNFNGVALNTIGGMLLHNYKDSVLVQTRNDTMTIYDNTLALAKEKLNYLAVEGASLYSLKHADMIFNLPTKSSEYHITSASVPFIQIVLHGYIDYVDEPINQFYDPSLQKLKMIEYGCAPYYEITNEATEKLKTSDYNKLFSSQYTNWKDDIINTYNTLSDGLAEVYDQPIVYHENTGDWAKVVYENGKTLYINYTDSAATHSDGVAVEALSFIVV